MAVENKEIRIVIAEESDQVILEGEKPAPKVKGSSGGVSTGGGGDGGTVSEKKEGRTLKTVLINQAWEHFKQDTTRIAEYEINKWFNLNDDYIGQRNLTAAKNIIGRAKSAATSIVAGIMVGASVGGHVGAIAGGVLAAAQQVAALVTDIAQNYDQQNIRIRQMDAQLQFSRQRVGFSLTSGRIGGDR